MPAIAVKLKLGEDVIRRGIRLWRETRGVALGVIAKRSKRIPD